MDGDEPLARKVAPFVQAVDVLGDEEVEAACDRQVGERPVARVRQGRPDELPGLPLVAPVALARALVGEELGERDGPVALPAAAGRPEIGDARGGREAGAGDDDDPARLAPEGGELLEAGHALKRARNRGGHNIVAAPPSSSVLLAAGARPSSTFRSKAA